MLVSGGGYSLVACLSHLTIGHASLSRRSTVPTPNRHLQHSGAHLIFSHILHKTSGEGVGAHFYTNSNGMSIQVATADKKDADYETFVFAREELNKATAASHGQYRTVPQQLAAQCRSQTEDRC